MSCLLPPPCLFCAHYHHSDAHDDALSCAAFEQIPDEIFCADILHSVGYPGDKGIQFELNQDLLDEFIEINNLRIDMGLEPYPYSSNGIQPDRRIDRSDNADQVLSYKEVKA